MFMQMHNIFIGKQMKFDMININMSFMIRRFQKFFIFYILYIFCILRIFFTCYILMFKL